MLAIISAPCIAASSIPVQATISNITGTVEVQKGKADWSQAKEGIALSPGDSVRTKEKASCIIKWSQGNLVKLQPLTTIKIDKNEFTPTTGVEKSSIDMKSGAVHVKAKRVSSAQSNFEIKTPTAIAGVRGTIFSVEIIEAKSTVVKCQQGKLNVKSLSGGEVTLTSGQMTTVISGSPPEQPKQMSVEDSSGFSAAAGSLSEPMLEITKPLGSGDKVSTPNLTIEGITSPGSLVEAYGATAMSNAQGLFSLNVNLQPGKNQIAITATDTSSKTVQKSIEVHYQHGNQGKESSDSCSEGQVLVCIDPEAEGEKELCIANAAVPARIKQGGCIGLCSDCATSDNATAEEDNQRITCTSEQVLICSKSGTTAQQESCLPIAAVAAYSDVGGCIGACGACVASSNENSNIVFADTLAPRLEIFEPSSNFEPGSGTCTQNGFIIQCGFMGFADPDAIITVSGQKITVNPDGSFNQMIEFSASLATITIVATNSTGNSTVKQILRTIDETKAAYLIVTVNPASIVADNESTATVTVTGTNILGKPVTGAVVSLSASTGGALSPSTITLNNGTGSTIFRAGAGSILNTVTITATASTGVSASAVLTLTPDYPPDITMH
jgi:hypothetical protein